MKNRTHIFLDLVATRDDAYVPEGSGYRSATRADVCLPLYIRTGNRYTILLQSDDEAAAELPPPDTRYCRGRGETTVV